MEGRRGVPVTPVARHGMLKSNSRSRTTWAAGADVAGTWQLVYFYHNKEVFLFLFVDPQLPGTISKYAL